MFGFRTQEAIACNPDIFWIKAIVSLGCTAEQKNWLLKSAPTLASTPEGSAVERIGTQPSKRIVVASQITIPVVSENVRRNTTPDAVKNLSSHKELS
jgi:hypothetical protein